MSAFAVRSSIKKRLLVMVGVMGIMILATGLYGLIRVAESNRRTAESVSEARLLVTAVDSARLAEVNFKKQVQEWKNVLLRGQDAALYEKHWVAFVTQEGLVRANLKNLKAVMEKMRIAAVPVDALLASHEALGGKYREALKKYDRKAVQSGMAVDRLVMGIDREVTGQIDALVEQIERQTAAGIDAREKESVLQSERDRKFSQGLLVMIALALGVGVVISKTIVRDIEQED